MFTKEELWQAHYALRLVAHWTASVSPESLEHVASMANVLAERAEDRPAAIFFAVGRYPRVFRDSWVDFARIYAGKVAHQHGLRLFVTRSTAQGWLVEIASQKLVFSELRERLNVLMVRLPSTGS